MRCNEILRMYIYIVHACHTFREFNTMVDIKLSEWAYHALPKKSVEVNHFYFILAYQTGFSAVFTSARKSWCKMTRALNDIISFRRCE